MIPITTKILKDEFKALKDELKVSFKENNKSLMKEVKSEIKSSIKENNEVLMKEVKSEIKSSIKENNKDIENLMGDMANTILNGVQSMFNDRDVKIEKLENGLEDVKRDIKFLHQDIRDIIADMSDKPSRKQFEEFKSSLKNYPMI